MIEMKKIFALTTALVLSSAASVGAQSHEMSDPRPTKNTVALAECMAFIVTSQEKDVIDMDGQRKAGMLLLNGPFNFEADIDGLSEAQRQNLVVEKMTKQYEIKEKKGLNALEALHKTKCRQELEKQMEANTQ